MIWRKKLVDVALGDFLILTVCLQKSFWLRKQFTNHSGKDSQFACDIVKY